MGFSRAPRLQRLDSWNYQRLVFLLKLTFLICLKELELQPYHCCKFSSPGCFKPWKLLLTNTLKKKKKVELTSQGIFFLLLWGKKAWFSLTQVNPTSWATIWDFWTNFNGEIWHLTLKHWWSKSDGAQNQLYQWWGFFTWTQSCCSNKLLLLPN